MLSRLDRWTVYTGTTFLVCSALFGAALYYGWIGYRSMPWDAFKNAYSLSQFSAVRFQGRQVTARYRDTNEAGAGAGTVIVEAPTDPLPVEEWKWFTYKAVKHGIDLELEPPQSAPTRQKP